MTPYEQVQFMRNTGFWPNKEIPKWAEDLATKYHVWPTSPIVVEHAMEMEIERLRQDLAEYRGES